MSENLRFSDVFRGYRIVTLGEYGLKGDGAVIESGVKYLDLVRSIYSYSPIILSQLNWKE